MQSTSSIAYEPIPNIVDQNNLEEVVIENSEKTHQTALDLFGNVHQELHKKSENYEKGFVNGFRGAVITGTAAAMPGIIVMISGNPMGAVGMALCEFIVIPFFGYATYNFKWGEYTQALLNKCESIKSFHNSFEDFKSDPQEFKVKNLFDLFQWIDLNEKQSELVPQDDLKLFQSTGKIFLMDAIAKILSENGKDSQVVKLWNETCNSTLKSKVGNAEPWQSMGISNPDLDAYLEFDKLRDKLESIMITDKIVSIFKNAIEMGLTNNKI